MYLSIRHDGEWLNVSGAMYCSLFCSPDKLIVTAPARNAPATGPVAVETLSGGQGKSSVEFSYVDPSVEHAERRATDGAFGLGQLLPWKQKAMGKVTCPWYKSFNLPLLHVVVPWCNG